MLRDFSGQIWAEPYPVTDSTPPRVRDTKLIIVAQCNTRNFWAIYLEISGLRSSPKSSFHSPSHWEEFISPANR
jgi:hypothetical protein